MATVDPVKYLRDDHGGVPANVNLYWNRYPAGKDLPIDHFDIIGVVESDLIKVLTQ